MAEFLSVEQAARALGVSDRRVRDLIAAHQLSAERVGQVWVLDAQGVRSRARHAPAAGRPLSPPAAWAVLEVAEAFHHSPSAAEERLRALADRQLRHRLHKLLVEPRSHERWRRSLARRAEVQRMWVHPGVQERLANDPRLRLGGAAAAVARGAGLAASGAGRFYVDAGSLDALVHEHRLKAEAEGGIELMVIPASVPGSLVPPRGEPVPLGVALADLLDSDDARESHVAGTWFESVALKGSP